MKKTILSLAIMAFAMCMNNCSNDIESAGTSSQYITVSTGIGSMTRVSTDANGSQTFTAGDQISIYAWTGDSAKAPAASYRVVDNAINTLGTDGQWTAAPQMLWKNTTDHHYFIGIYPKTETSVADLSAGDYTLDVNKQKQSDLLVATNLEGLTSKDHPVFLNFNHVMAKLTVNLMFRNQWGGTPTVESVTLKGVATNAKVNYLTQTLTAGTTTGDISLPATTANETYTSIIIPQKGVKSIVVKIDGEDYTYTNTNKDGIKLESGKITSINLIVGRNKIDETAVNINDWETKDLETGEAQ